MLPARPLPPTPPFARVEPRPPPRIVRGRRGQQRLASPRCRGRGASVPTSVRSPPARRRPRRIPGSPRVTSTNWEPAGTCSARNARIERLLLAVTRCTSSSTSKNGSRSRRSAARRGSATSSIRGVLRDNSSSRSLPRGPVRSRAVATRVSSTTGSLSPRASCTQPPGRGSRRLHCATSVDLPYPAGAETSTTRLRWTASWSGARRGRATASERTGGAMPADASSRCWRSSGGEELAISVPHAAERRESA